jgi:predicted dehydrogenase
MALDLTADQKALGRANFNETRDGLSRRGFMQGLVGATGAAGVTTAAGYFGYKALTGGPVKVALIGCGDEGGVLANEHNPQFTQIVAVCDVRPFNLDIKDGKAVGGRIIEGDKSIPPGIRDGLRKHYGNETGNIRAYTDYKQLLNDEKDLEAVIIALPLHLHAPVAIDCMKKGKERGKPIHVLCEKLMAWNIKQCKQMIKVADETGSILSIGHQRHYSLLYAQATEILKADVLGDIKHIRALWHRNNSWPLDLTDEEKALLAKDVPQPTIRDGWFPRLTQKDFDALNNPELLKKYGYDSVHQLVRWRLFNSTGGGLMAELGSHQLDACSIFLGKVHPLAVTAVGGKFYYGPGRNDRESDDHVFVTYEFPGKNHPKGANKGSDKSDIVVVTYSSINTNGFEAYGECVMGSKGTMVVEAEKDILLFTERKPADKNAGPPRSTTVKVDGPNDKPAVVASGTWGPGGGAAAASGGGAASVVSRGYREEMEDFAYCIRQWDAKVGYDKDEKGNFRQRLPRCHGRVAMADAIVALTANHAMRPDKEGKPVTRIEFNENWFKAESDQVPDNAADKPQVPVVEV